MTGRIDVHHHLVAPAWRDALTARGTDSGGWPVPAWSAEEALATMDRVGVATAVLSTTAPGVHFGDDGEARELARAVNEHAAGIAAAAPDRFGSFASVPLPDVDGALAETAHALDDLGADGIVLMSNVGGRYLGDPAYEPLWAELDRRAAVVFVHPAQPPMPLLSGTPAPLADFVFDTTRSALNLVLAGVPRRYPNVKVILAHGGGFLPYAAHRFAALATVGDAPGTPEDILADLRWFYLDTALSASPTSLPSLLAFAAPGHVLYGSDWPFAPEATGRYFDAFLDAEPARAAIDRASAEALFPRLGGR